MIKMLTDPNYIRFTHNVKPQRGYPMLNVKNVRRTYKSGEYNLHALNGIDLTLVKGDFAFLLGESGSGKSTLLNVISGLDRPTEGSVLVDGVDTSTFSRKDWATFRNNHIGFIFQEFNLIEHLDVLQNVALPLIFQGTPRKDARMRAREELDRIGLSNHVDKKPMQLSGGQQQRVAIARALVTDPKIILADEPTGALDEEMGRKVIAYLKKHAADKVVLVVTHDEDLAEAFAERTLHIEDGRIVSDSAEGTSADESSREVLLDPPRMRFGMLMKFASNNIFSRMFRTLFTSAIVSIGFIAILLLTFIVFGIRGSISETVGEIVPPDEYQIHALEDTALDETTFLSVSDYPGIEHLRYNIDHSDQARYLGADHSVNYRPLPYDSLAFDRQGSLHGRLPETDDEIVISLRTALDLRNQSMVDEEDYAYVFGLVEGREITFETTEDTHSFTIVGMSEERFQPLIYVEYDKLVSILQEHPDARFRDSAIAYLGIDDEADIDELRTTLRDEENVVMRNVHGEITSTIDEVMFSALRWLVGIAAVSLIISAILVGLVVYTSVLERIREIGVLTALGARQANIRAIFLLESGFTGLISGVIGAVLSVMIAIGINRLFSNFIQAPLNLITGGSIDITLLEPSVPLIALIIIGGMFYAMLAGILPAHLASRMDAIRALRKE